MKNIFIFFSTFLISQIVTAAQPLISPQELQTKLSDSKVSILDIRDPKSYAENHIPGALNAPYGKWRGPKENPGQLPSLEKLTHLVQSLGLSNDKHIIVTSSGADETDFGATARVYWTLKVLGLKNLSILNGGLKAWNNSKLALDKQTVTVSKSTYQPKINNDLIATKEELLTKSTNGTAAIIDARPKAFFNGETRHQASKIPGTIKGATNLEHSKWFNKNDPTFVSPTIAQKVASDANLKKDEEVILFCNTGHWAATNWFAMSEVLGQKNVSMYAGSMVEFTKDPEAETMANVPSRSKQLWIDLKLFSERTFN
jgi:thiosulfate/3-mercaptopyruvate sulfurtransferase